MEAGLSGRILGSQMDKELETGVTQTQGIYDPNYSCTSIAISGHLGGL